jgi:carbonic anhydrase
VRAESRSELLRSATVLPDTITVSGHVYDVTTGLVRTIVSAAPMHHRTSTVPNEE